MPARSIKEWLYSCSGVVTTNSAEIQEGCFGKTAKLVRGRVLLKNSAGLQRCSMLSVRRVPEIQWYT